METIFNPQSIAIIGLSSKSNNIPRLTLENMLRWGYRGQIFGVNPRGGDEYVDGIRMYKEIEDLPMTPDLVYSLIPARLVPEMVERCGQMGVTRMAIPSGGFSEYGGKGDDLARRTLSTARKYGIRFVGPNGLTVANTKNGLCFPFAPSIKPPTGNISIISQSGGIGLMIMNYFKDENLGMAKFASIGNKLDLDEVDFLEYLGADPDTDIICMYLESIARGLDLARAAAKIDKPVIMYKSNTTDSGKKAAMSHTAAISSDEDVLDSMCQDVGITRVRHFHDFFAVAKAHKLPPMKGKRVMVLSPAGGLSVMMADLCEKAGFEFADLGQDFYDSLAKYANAGVINFSNPLDMGDIYDPKLVEHVICSVMHSDQVDGTLYASYSPPMPAGDNVFRGMLRTDLSMESWGAILSSGKPLGAALVSPRLSPFKQAINVPIFNSPEELVRAMALQMTFHTEKEYRASVAEDVPVRENQAAIAWVDSHMGPRGEEALELLEHWGISVPKSATAATENDVEGAVKDLTFPIVMKVISPDALHKTDVGGVITGIENQEEAKNAFCKIRDNLQAAKPDARFEGVRAMEMAGPGLDLFIGGKMDDSFGPVVFFGMGGIYVELYKDAANALCPAKPETIYKRLKKLKCHSLLQGARGQAPGDIDAFVDLVACVSKILASDPRIKELDLNPVRVFEKGALPLDVRIKTE